MKYFYNCKNIEDVKKEFHKLAKELHPDNGGDEIEFKKMMNLYMEAFSHLKSVHDSKGGYTYKKETEEDQTTTETPEQFARIIEALIHFEGITIEIIGTWIWVSGNTYPIKENLKELHFFYSKGKKAWYHTGEAQKSRRRGRYNMSQLRDKWGSQQVKTGVYQRLEA